MNITFSKKAVKVLKSLDTATEDRILKGIIGMPQGDIKPLKGTTDTHRLRVGDWRILFSYPDDDTILIEKIALRGDAYKGA